MKKSAVAGFCLLVFVLCIASVLAANETTSSTKSDMSSIDKAYQCLESQIANKTASTLSFQEATFAMMAVGSKGAAKTVIDSNKHDKEACWPKSGCRIKDTAQVALAFQRAGIPTADVKNWLISKKGLPTDLVWYLELDISQHIPASCTIRYDGRDYKVSVNADMTLSNSAGSCLTLSESSYWLRINNNCLSKGFEVSCDQDFITTLLYQRTAGETVYVSSTTRSAPSLGTTNESVSVSCFKTGTTCDYEGSLWAALALQKIGEETKDVTPYLVALADDNTRYFPSSFLYALTSDEEYYSNVIDLRKQGQFWEMLGNLYNRYYDTSLGLLALGGSSASSGEVDKTKQYLTSIQTKEGCWNNNNIRDTAFLLYSGWPRGVTAGSSGKSTLISCVEGGFSCERQSECTTAGGIKKEGFECSSATSICCSVAVKKLTCAQEKGVTCNVNEECDGSSFEAGDGACCLGSCKEIETAPACEIAGGICRTSCENGEISTSEMCTANDICCVTEQDDGGLGWGWIVFIILLIIIVVLAIIFRNQLRVLWFKYKGRASSSPVTRPRPSSGDGAAVMPHVMRPVSLGGPRPSRPMPQRPASKDREFDETLRKLKDMSK